MAYTDIDKPSDYFNTVTYTASGSGQSVTGVNFQPDLVWLKIRNTTGSHYLNDSVRGVQKSIYSNETDAETSDNYLTSFDSDGFSLGSGNYTSPNTIVGWNWLASNTTASNTDGSITSTVSANTTSGFSIATYTGNGTGSATIGHGLGSAPKFVIIKNRGRAGESWQTWFDNDKRLNLNSTSVSFISTHPISTSSTVVTTPSTADAGWNTNNDTYVMYSFAEKKGFSKFGSYTGNGSTDGVFCYNGMKPAFIMIKSSSLAESWFMYDVKRSTFNVVDRYLMANASNVEETSTSNYIDILSNGFKVRSLDSRVNSSGNTYIYMAFSENPFVTSGGIPTTAR